MKCYNNYFILISQAANLSKNITPDRKKSYNGRIYTNNMKVFNYFLIF